ncbi:hypothetical protein Hypma_002737 [Hypsizygus marmoreus]|uniref:Uncharacterized protein n=1 Tax=Hypsizygus marmoreus TaxID=39966 RepID=A0A369J9D3_HYPMA|nr:hypothetical protein Hypma_002737 [Hypsizygus marmoreus]
MPFNHSDVPRQDPAVYMYLSSLERTSKSRQLSQFDPTILASEGLQMSSPPTSSSPHPETHFLLCTNLILISRELLYTIALSYAVLGIILWNVPSGYLTASISASRLLALVVVCSIVVFMAFAGCFAVLRLIYPRWAKWIWVWRTVEDDQLSHEKRDLEQAPGRTGVGTVGHDGKIGSEAEAERDWR